MTIQINNNTDTLTPSSGELTLGASRLLISTGTVTASTPALSATQTWNNAAVAFTSDLLNITDTASAAGSLLIDRQVGGVSKFSVDKSGKGYLANRLLLNTTTDNGVDTLQVNGSANISGGLSSGITQNTAIYTQRGQTASVAQLTPTLILSPGTYSTWILTAQGVTTTSSIAHAIVTFDGAGGGQITALDNYGITFITGTNAIYVELGSGAATQSIIWTALRIFGQFG